MTCQDQGRPGRDGGKGNLGHAGITSMAQPKATAAKGYPPLLHTTQGIGPFCQAPLRG